MRIDSVFLLTLMLLVPLTPLVEPTEATNARSQPCGGTICINEVMPNPNGLDTDVWPNGEWLELHNSGTSSVDVRNWYFSNKQRKHSTLILHQLLAMMRQTHPHILLLQEDI